MKYLKHCLLLLVPVGAVAAVAAGLFWLTPSVNTPAFAGYHQYLEMLLEPDILPAILRNLFPFFMVAMVTAAVMCIIYGFLREKLQRVHGLLVYSAIWLVTAGSAINASFWDLQAYGLPGDRYSADSIVATPSRGGMSIFSILMGCLLASVATFLVYTVYRLVIRYRSTHPGGSGINNDILLTAGVTLMGAYAVLHYVNDVLRTALQLNVDTFGARYVFNRLLVGDLLTVVATVVGVVLLLRLRAGKGNTRALTVGLLVLSALVLLKAIVFDSDSLSLNFTYITTGVSVRFYAVWVALKTAGGSLIDIAASVILIIATARMLNSIGETPSQPQKITGIASWIVGLAGGIVLAVILGGAGLSLIDTQSAGGSVGIIGGADASTMWFLYTSVLRKNFSMALMVCLLFLAAAVVLRIISQKQKSRG